MVQRTQKPETSPPIHHRIAAAIRRLGVTRVAKTIGIGPEATLRLALGLPTHRGTIVLAERALPELEAAP